MRYYIRGSASHALAWLLALAIVSACVVVTPVSGEGAGESLADVSACLQLITDLQGSSLYLLDRGELLVDFNGTLYGSNGTVYVIAEPDDGEIAIDDPQQNTTADQNLTSLDNATLGNETLLLSLETRFLALDTPVPILESELMPNGTILSAFDEFEGEQLDMLIALQTDVQNVALPLACQGFDLTPENETEANLTASDTVVVTTVNEEGETITTTCITQVTTLQNSILRVHVIGDETEAYLDQDGILRGYIGETFGFMQTLVGNVTFDYYNLTLDALVSYPLSPWDACIWDLHNNKVDLCLGEFFDTPERRTLTEFSALIQLKSVVLLAPKSAAGVDFGRLLAPFSPGLWGCILGVLVMHTLLLWLFNFRRESVNFDESFSEFKRLGHSVHLSLQSVFAASMVTNLETPTLAEYWLSCGFALFIVVIIAAYTANLAAIMTMTTLNSQFESLDDIVKGGYSICVQTSLVTPLEVYAGSALPIIATGSATESLNFIDQQKCMGAVLQMDAMQYASQEHCSSKVMIGSALFSLPTGVPVRMKYEGLVSQWISSLRVTGVISNFFTNMVDEIAPEVCPAIESTEADETASMTVEHAAALLIVTLCIFVVACACAIFERGYRKAKKSPKMQKYPSPNRGDGQGEVAPEMYQAQPAVGVSPLSDASTGIRVGNDREDGALEAIMQQIQLLNQSQQETRQELRQLAAK